MSDDFDPNSDFTPLNNIQQEVINDASAEGIDPQLAYNQAQQESRFNQNAVSPAGAIGVMQLMPGTADDLGVDPTDWKQNIKGGTHYLKQQLDAFGGDPTTALMAYNWGPGHVKNWIANGSNPDAVPTETKKYVNNILKGAHTNDAFHVDASADNSFNPETDFTPVDSPFDSNKDFTPTTATLTPAENEAANMVPPSTIGAAVQGAAQGAALGGANVIEAGLAPVGQGIITGIGSGLRNALDLAHENGMFKNIPAIPQNKLTTFNPGELSNLYSQGKQHAEANDIASQVAHPNVYNAGAAAGALANIPGGAAIGKAAVSPAVIALKGVASHPLAAGALEYMLGGGLSGGALTSALAPAGKVVANILGKTAMGVGAGLGGLNAEDKTANFQNNLANNPTTLTANNIDDHKQDLGSYYPILKEAASKSPQNLAVTTYALQQRDKNFQKLYTDLQNKIGQENKIESHETGVGMPMTNFGS